MGRESGENCVQHEWAGCLAREASVKQPLINPTLWVTGLELEALLVDHFSRKKKKNCLETMDCLLRSKYHRVNISKKIFLLKSCVGWSLGDFLGLKMGLYSIA